MTTILEDQERPLISIGDTRSYCAECSGELGMVRVSPHRLRLMHVKEPPTLHAPRLRLASRGPLPDPGQGATLGREPNARGSARTGDEAPSEPGDSDLNSRVPTANLRSQPADTDGDIGDPSSGR